MGFIDNLLMSLFLLTIDFLHKILLTADYSAVEFNDYISKAISNDQELIQSDPIFCPQNQTP